MPSGCPWSCSPCSTWPGRRAGRRSRRSGWSPSPALGLAPIAFLFALLDARLARGEVAGLLVELRADPTKDLQAPLARALRDPSLKLAYWLPEQGTWADQNGHPMPVPQADDRRALRIISRDDEPMAALLFDRSLADERELLDAVAAAAGIALENGRLQAELRARLQELQGSRVRVLEAGQRERQRLERNLHDGAQQRLVALSLELGLLGERADTDPDTRTRLARAKAEVSALPGRAPRCRARHLSGGVDQPRTGAWPSSRWPERRRCRCDWMSTFRPGCPSRSKWRRTTW